MVDECDSLKVAGIVKDKAYSDLLKENKDLREEKAAWDEVRVEGTDATTGQTVVYARGNMQQGIAGKRLWFCW